MRHIPCSFPEISFYLHALNSPESFGEKLAHQHIVVHPGSHEHTLTLLSYVES
jgi:hypothetical protein